MRKILFFVGALAALAMAPVAANAVTPPSYDLLLNASNSTVDGSGGIWTGSFSTLNGLYNISVGLANSVDLNSVAWGAEFDFTSGGHTISYGWTGPEVSFAPIEFHSGTTYDYTFAFIGADGSNVNSAQLNSVPVPSPVAGAGLGGLLAAIFAGGLLIARRSAT